MNTVIFLFIIILNYGNLEHVYRTPMPDMGTCQSALKHSKSDISNGAESENGVVMYCGGDISRLNHNTEEWEKYEDED